MPNVGADKFVVILNFALLQNVSLLVLHSVYAIRLSSLMTQTYTQRSVRRSLRL
jgi:hypothetical protein